MAPPSLQVVLVDDDEDRQLIRWALTNAIDPICIEEMSSGQALIDWLSHQRRLSAAGVPLQAESMSVILLDMHMPALTGLETLQALGDLRDLPYMPVVLLTASISEQLKQQAYQQGIHLYMAKLTGAIGYYRVVEAVKLCYRDALQVRAQHRLNKGFY